MLIHQSASASANDAGWIHLAPGLKDTPLQVDLLGVANQCFLAMLGSAPVAPASGEVDYTVGANALVPGSAGQADCSSSSLQTTLTDTNATLSVTSGTPVTAATLSFTDCQ